MGFLIGLMYILGNNILRHTRKLKGDWFKLKIYRRLDEGLIMKIEMPVSILASFFDFISKKIIVPIILSLVGYIFYLLFGI